MGSRTHLRGEGWNNDRDRPDRLQSSIWVPRRGSGQGPRWTPSQTEDRQDVQSQGDQIAKGSPSAWEI